MPMETIYFVIAIGTTTDSMPLDGPKLAQFLQEGLVKYRLFEEERDKCGSITELENIYDIDPIDLNRIVKLWDSQEGWTGD